MTDIENRRGFLRVLGGVTAFAGFGQAFGQTATPVAAAAVPKSPAELLNLATTAEALAVTFYFHALSGAQFRMDDDTRQQLGRVLQAEQHHLELLTSLGGKPLTRTFNLPADLNSDARSFAETGLQLEAVFTSAYIAATHQFAELGHPELAATAAQLGASEAQHLSLLSQLAGFGSGELTLPTASLRQLTDAPPVLAPYLAGGRVPLPGAAAVQTLCGAAESSPRAFVQAFSASRRG
ncbi:ferritin-like domain-containing protein [Deinococcus sp.]|uniref:ferritin-like domain-containing protein n=1 Tax=Deinococcus sp. TaxID=47478 RepID=UPI0025BEA58E|nr:ferritin-like domain-containing protein [Deinococcus sp.]